MKRRNFLQSSLFASAPFMLNSLPVSALKHKQLFNFFNLENDKILILIELSGGNDGLNTVVPLDQYANLFNHRSNIIIPESALLTMNATNGLHPSMVGMKRLYDDARLSIIQNVGYENQNRSHFRSIDIWNSASAADEYINTGWMGRYLDQNHPTYPDNYPNEDFPDPIAMTIGSLTSDTCQGIGSNFSLAIQNPDNLSALPDYGEFQYPDTLYGNELEYLANSIQQTNAYQEVLTAASEAGTNLSPKYEINGSTRLKERLQVIARLISGGLRTKVYITSIGGFDTHSGQVESNNFAQGTHAELLFELSDAIEAFQDDLKLQGLEEKVVGMTFSEFGRRIKSNGSLGTDHGSAAPMFVFGSCINAGVIGNNPTIAAEVANQEGVAMDYDFKSIYGSILMDWFEVEESTVRSILYSDFQYLPIISSCQTTSVDPVEDLGYSITLSPNPTHGPVNLDIELDKPEWIKLGVFDTLGAQIKLISNQSLGTGHHLIQFELNDLSTGIYFVRCQFKNSSKTFRIVKS
ncbi:MAG: DUF1501 domain-containing protein [Bacteroidia bacterium]|nr:DUF1501 domain-containing protein [Bacteroidia bacterium]